MVFTKISVRIDFLDELDEAGLALFASQFGDPSSGAVLDLVTSVA